MGAIIILHRYLGVAVGIVMTLWCLSGFVMMYQSFPSLSDEDRLTGLHPLALEGCCAFDDLAVDPETQVSGFRAEMLGDRPVLRLATGGPERIYDLTTGARLDAITEDDARAAADAFRVGHGLSTDVDRVETVDLDQWTIQLYSRHAPMWRFDYADGRGSSLYVSGRTGEVIQATTLRVRTLAWLGAIPHWLYPTILRQNGPLWAQVVIWASVIGVFLTVTGLVVGVSRLRRRKGRWFPYRRVWLWHHAAGVFFGVLTLTWVFSGLLTMDPWGVLVSTPSVGRGEVVGAATWRDARALLAQAPAIARTDDARQLRDATLAGSPYMVAEGPNGPRRFATDGSAAPLTPESLEPALRGRGGALADARVTLQEREDAYYYAHHLDVVLPVLRVDLGDAAATSLYVDPRTGDLLRLVDTTRRQNRWLETGLHSLDFPVLRQRPIWDVVVILLLAGVTAVCATGAWLSISRVRRDIASSHRFRRDPKQTAAE